MKNLKCFCKGLTRPNTALLIIRVGVGAVFLLSGIQKLSDMQMITMMFGQMGIGAFWAWAVAILETLGGLALIIGMGTMIAAFILAVIMLVASILMMRIGGMMAMMSPLGYLIASLSLVFSGAGRYSLDSRCPCWKSCGAAGAAGIEGTKSGMCSMESMGDCPCCKSSPDNCQCPSSCTRCNCNSVQSTTESMNCTCSNGICVCDSTCEGCDCEK